MAHIKLNFYSKDYVECLVNQSPGLVRLGDQGHLLMVRLLSSPAGFKQMQQANFVNNELDKWANHFNYRYILRFFSVVGFSIALHSSLRRNSSECSLYDEALSIRVLLFVFLTRCDHVSHLSWCNIRNRTMEEWDISTLLRTMDSQSP